MKTIFSIIGALATWAAFIALVAWISVKAEIAYAKWKEKRNPKQRGRNSFRSVSR